MGNDDDCPRPKNNTEIVSNRNNAKIEAKTYFEMYNSMKLILLNLQQMNFILYNIYLIKANSIPNFIRIINNSGVLGKIERKIDESECEAKLKQLFEDYKIETPKFLKDYKECIEIKEEDNEFIFASELFLKKMNCFGENERFIVTLKKNSNKIEIEFPVSKKIIQIKQKKFGLYKFEKDNAIIPDEINNSIVSKNDNDQNNYTSIYSYSPGENNSEVKVENYTQFMIKQIKENQ